MTAVGLRSLAPKRDEPGSGRFDPWTVELVVRVVVLNAAALAVVGAAAYQANAAVTVRTQLAWLNVSVAGLVCAGVTNAAWLLHGRRVLVAARRGLFGGTQFAPGDASTRETMYPETRGRGGLFVSGANMTRYHRIDCPLAVGKELRGADRARHERAGRRACEACRP
jgi:hypothetical protein